MSIERELLVSLLKLSKNGVILNENINIDARIPSSISHNLLLKLQNDGLVYLNAGSIEIEDDSRIKIAIKALSLGGDLEYISKLLFWQEFEEMAALALKNNGYAVHNNVRFKNSSKRWEIDVVGCKKPLVICIDCKHWQNGIGTTSLEKIVNLQKNRTKALADSMPNMKLKLECTEWEKAKFIPAVLSLVHCRSKFHNNVPLVPVLQLQDFINQLPAYIETLDFYPKTFNTLNDNLSN